MKKPGFFSGLKADAPQTVQQSIPYKEMYRDGICRVSGNYYTKTVQFFDINYQLAQADDKAQIFEGYCDFLNYFDASIHVQLTFINQRANMQDFVHSIEIPARGDEYDGIRREYADMLKNQLQKGNNGLTKRKYITYGIEAEALRTAKMRLERIETDVLGNFKALGVQARPLNGLERLELLHSQLHPDGQEKLHFNWSDLPKTGLSTKDYIAPSGLSFSQDGKPFRVGELRARVAAHLRRQNRVPVYRMVRSGVSFDMTGKSASYAEKELPLTRSEYAICEYLALHAGQTFTKEQIYEAVFGVDGTADDTAITQHIKNIRVKLRAAGAPETLLKTVWGVGYQWKSEN